MVYTRSMLKNMPFEPEDLMPYATKPRARPVAKPETETALEPAPPATQELFQVNSDNTFYGVLALIGIAYVYLAPRSPLVPVLFIAAALKFIEWICMHGLIA